MLRKVEIFVESKNVDILVRPGSILQRVVVDTEIVSASMHSSYRDAGGKLLYIATKSRPEICNAARELSKHLDQPLEEHIKAENQVMNYVSNMGICVTSETSGLSKHCVTATTVETRTQD